MDTNAVIESWIEARIAEFEKQLSDYYGQDEVLNSRFPKIGNTQTARWRAQLDILKDLQEFKTTMFDGLRAVAKSNCKCGGVGLEPHTCPYAEEIENDNGLCTCCMDCIQECMNDV